MLMCVDMSWPSVSSLPYSLSLRACPALAPEGLILSPSAPSTGTYGLAHSSVLCVEGRHVHKGCGHPCCLCLA